MEQKPDRPSQGKRKKDHIDLALKSQIAALDADSRFYYEPILNGHPERNCVPETAWAGKILKNPIWVSSMTGGAKESGVINSRLAKVCREFGLGMGLGSCRSLLDSDQFLPDFNVRKDIGEDAPLFANLGIAQMEQIQTQHAWEKIEKMIKKLDADGLIIHVNPFQEWLQPEGDKIINPPIVTIMGALKNLKVPLIVKEVGQGIGPKSLEALMKLPLTAIEFAALGGTNFSTLELKRQDDHKRNQYEVLSKIGHTAVEMTEYVNNLAISLNDKIKCKSFILSGGIKDFLDGYYLMHKLHFKSIYGQASGFLAPARKSYEALYDHVKAQVNGLQIAYTYLHVR
ncbi:MAG: isopentenyl-diphosphate delta-isomerase [Saprospiraceae bacterium]|nr:isopentenyl-diphosphate delta-isomerase [Saprospiraceae bacterium]